MTQQPHRDRSDEHDDDRGSDRHHHHSGNHGDRNEHDRDDRDDDDWERIGATLDWVAASFADRLGRDPIDLVRPALVVGLAAGLAAEALSFSTGGELTLVLLGVALTLFGYGMLWLLAERFRQGSSGTQRTAEADMLAPWLRRLQVLMLAALAIVVALALYGSITGSWLLVARNTLELGRVGVVVLVMSWLLLDGDVGMPDWIASLLRRPVTDH